MSLTRFLRTPHQASRIFGLDGPAAPRPKNLFYVNFRRGNDTAASQASQRTWQRDLSYRVKAVDRPGVTPEVQELNQYNKKRQVYTGYKLQQMKVTFYDTVDNTAGQMWNDYAQHYFGDFRHDKARDDFRWDVMADEYRDTATEDGFGFGFAPRRASQSEMEENVQFFFDTISVYQVFGGKFIQFDIINPKITSFDADDLSYEDSGIGLFTMVVAYEAIIYVNNGKPQAILSNETVGEAFAEGSGQFDGDVIEPDDGTP
jgi:hypothetical protein